MKKHVLTIVLIPINALGIFFTVKQLTGSGETAWRMLEIVGGMMIVVGLAVFLARKLNKPKKPNQDTADFC